MYVITEGHHDGVKGPVSHGHRDISNLRPVFDSHFLIDFIICDKQNLERKQVFIPGTCLSLYLMDNSCRPVSDGAYFTVIVPSLFSIICGVSMRPDGVFTSPM